MDESRQLPILTTAKSCFRKQLDRIEGCHSERHEYGWEEESKRDRVERRKLRLFRSTTQRYVVKTR